MDDYNPYDAPQSDIVSDALVGDAEEGKGVWRDGKILVMVKIARLPSRCLKCDEPAKTRLKRTLAWHHPGLYALLILIFLLSCIGIFIYVVVALIVRKTAKIEIPLCDQHRASRVRAIWAAWVGILVGVGLIAAGVRLETDYGYLIWLGVFVFLVFAIYGAVRSQPVRPRKIDETHVWLKGVCPEYLDRLPRLPSPYGEPDLLIFPEL